MMQINPDRDIVVEPILKAPPALVWRYWTEPDGTAPSPGT